MELLNNLRKCEEIYVEISNKVDLLQFSISIDFLSIIQLKNDKLNTFLTNSMMNQLETNLTLWAICSILLFELLFIICLCRCCFNRLKPKKFYIKREEYEYLPDSNTDTKSKFRATILRPPHADELAHIGTLREQHPFVSYDLNSYSNHGFVFDENNTRQSPIEFPSSKHWLELHTPMIQTSQLPPADYEIRSHIPYRQQSTLLPRPTLIDYGQNRYNYDENNDEIIESYRLQCLRRPEIILPRVKRIDTSTESYHINYTNILPKSILKTATNSTPPIDYSPSSYLQTPRSRISSKYDEILSPEQEIKFANINQLNEIEWETPGEFQKSIFFNRQRVPSILLDRKAPMSWQTEYLTNHDINQQKAFEY